MSCELKTPKLWQTVCEHWHMPEFCYSHTDSIQYKVMVKNVTVKNNCAYIEAINVTLDDS